MDAFFTWDYLLSYAGCVLVTGLLTQGLKALFKKVPPQIISYVIALAILLVGQAVTGKLDGWGVVALDVLNAAAISLTSNGGYDAVTGIVKPEEKAVQEE
jgi:hypothetical protein